MNTVDMSATEGTKTPLHMIPGTMCDERLWESLLPELPGVAPHHIPIPAGDSVAALVEGLLSRLPEQPVNLFGFSLGGYLAAALATAYPQRIRRLFICSNTPCALPEEELNQRRQLLNWVRRHGYGGISDRKIAAMLGPESRERADIARTMRAMDATLGEAALIAQLGGTSERKDLADALASLPLPVTFCYGEHDTLVTRSWLQGLRRRRRDLTVREIPAAGHMLPLERPGALADAMLTWLSSPLDNFPG
ncbi:alpha/beta fold hydrolase [Microbulbifer guangxiensis]|uniref:alpha/beta fold hydrolase n=1 Tax=Microbulbifer guangxiensis TaxID=2904249 RepID=UPI001F2FFC78|nr:alpha/beta hydrolase [Microbulbifer guangxiensis]